MKEEIATEVRRKCVAIGRIFSSLQRGIFDTPRIDYVTLFGRRSLSGRRASRERRRDLDGRGNRRGALLDRCRAPRSRGSAGFVVADVRQGAFEFPDPLAERLADLRKPLRAED